MNYDVDYFIRKFSAIPNSKWCLYALLDGKGAHCVNGHMGVKSSDLEKDPLGQYACNFHHTEESEALNTLCKKYLKLPSHEINDGMGGTREWALSPKERIMVSLYKIKELQDKEFPPQPEPPKEKTKYVAVSESLREVAEGIVLDSVLGN